MSRRALWGVLGLVLVVAIGVGGHWVAQRTFLAKDEIRVRVHLPLLVHLDKSDMKGTLTGKAGISEVRLPPYRLPAWFMYFPLRPDRMAAHGVSEAEILTVLREEVARGPNPERVSLAAEDYAVRPPGRTGTGGAEIIPTARRIIVVVQGSSPVPPPVFAALKSVRIRTGGSPVGMLDVAGIPVMSAGSFGRTNFTVEIALQDRWHYPEARDAVALYLEAAARTAPPLPAIYNIPPPRDGRAYRILE